MSETNYNLHGEEGDSAIPTPILPYLPPKPKSYRPKIGLIGCGGITESHLKAYKAQAYEVVGLCDLNEEAATSRQKAFYPEAKVFTDYKDLLKMEKIDVVDIALHPDPRLKAIEDALLAGKHVLSQKPFVLDLDAGERIVRLAESKNLKLAVNQNGRRAPYVRAIASAIQQNLVGEVQSISMHLHWNHTWVKGTAFEFIHHLILYDFAIHWIDMTRLFMGGKTATSSFAQNEDERSKFPINPRIEPLDSGDLDNQSILKSLQNQQFKGPIGIQGYSVNASAKEALLRSANRLKILLASLD